MTIVTLELHFAFKFHFLYLGFVQLYVFVLLNHLVCASL